MPSFFNRAESWICSSSFNTDAIFVTNCACWENMSLKSFSPLEVNWIVVARRSFRERDALHKSVLFQIIDYNGNIPPARQHLRTKAPHFHGTKMAKGLNHGKLRLRQPVALNIETRKPAECRTCPRQLYPEAQGKVGFLSVFFCRFQGYLFQI